MPAGQGKVLTLERLHRRITDLKMPATENVLKRAAEIKQELALGVEKPFQELIPCYSEAVHSVGQKPLTFIRQVAAICAFPEPLNSDSLPEDAKQRARSLLEELDGGTIGHVQSRKCIEEVIRLAADENLLLFVDEVNQDAVFAQGCQFHSFKKVLIEMGQPYSEDVQLISFHSISNAVFGEGALQGAYFEFINIDEEVMEYLHLNAFFGHPPVLGMIALDLMLHPPMPGDPSHYTYVAERQQVLDKLAKQARLTEEILNQGSGIHCNPIQGAMYAFPRIEIPDQAVKMAQTQGLEPDVFSF